EIPRFSRSLAWSSVSISHVPTNPLAPVINRRESDRDFQRPLVDSSTWSRSRGGRGAIRALLRRVRGRDHAVKGLQNIVQHLARDSRIHADPENMVHHEIGVFQRARNSVPDILICGLPRQVAGEQEPRRDLAFLQILDYRMARKRAAWADGDRKPKPARIGAGRRLRKNKKILQPRKPFPQHPEVGLTPFDEAG